MRWFGASLFLVFGVLVAAVSFYEFWQVGTGGVTISQTVANSAAAHVRATYIGTALAFFIFGGLLVHFLGWKP